MAIYYVDYENVHNEGLKGVQHLRQGDMLTLFYSSKADTMKIDVVRQLMECPVEIRFEKIVNGVENALDFQLITALMCNYASEESYYIISRDKGYDAAIEMAGKQNRVNIYRCRDIEGAIKHYRGLGIDESDQDVIVDMQMDTEYPEAVAEEVVAEDEAFAQDEAVVQHPVFELVPDKSGIEPGEAQDRQEAESGHQAGKAPVSGDDVFANAIMAFEKVHGKPLEAAGDGSGETANNTAECSQELSPDAEEALESQEAIGQEDESQEPVSDVPDQQELERRAYQSMCTKILNNIKMVHKIPLNYKLAGEIYEALQDSDSKMQFYHRLLQSMGRKKGGELYQKVKAIYKPIRALYQASLEADESKAGGSDAQDSSQPQVEEIVQADAANKDKKHKPARKKDKADSVESVKEAFEQAEQLQGNPGEAILQMVDLVKNK